MGRKSQNGRVGHFDRQTRSTFGRPLGRVSPFLIALKMALTRPDQTQTPYAEVQSFPLSRVYRTTTALSATSLEFDCLRLAPSL